MKAIFLDVDGVIVYSGCVNASRYDIDYMKVKLLKEIVDVTGAVIVLSSSWKYKFDRETGEKRKQYQVLEESLEAYGLKIHDLTPNLKSVYKDSKRPMEELLAEPVGHSILRAVEIKTWIDDNKPESFVILDDEDFEWKYFGYDKYWIEGSYDIDGGLHEEDVEKAVSILNRKGDD